MRSVLIAAFDGAGNEPEALRQALEVFGFLVTTKYVARPRDFMDILEDRLPVPADYVILSCHGEDGRIIMPRLGENIYAPGEPRGNFSSVEIERYCRLSGKTILNLGCTTGQSGISNVFAKRNQYIAPTDYVLGNSALMFAIRFFYELAQNNENIRNAYSISAQMDSETELFAYYPAI